MRHPLHLLNPNISLENLRFIGRCPRNVQFIRFSPSNIQLPIIFESSDFHVDQFIFKIWFSKKSKILEIFDFLDYPRVNTYVYGYGFYGIVELGLTCGRHDMDNYQL